jgi:hypothetical protein
MFLRFFCARLLVYSATGQARQMCNDFGNRISCRDDVHGFGAIKLPVRFDPPAPTIPAAPDLATENCANLHIQGESR